MGQTNEMLERSRIKLNWFNNNIFQLSNCFSPFCCITCVRSLFLFPFPNMKAKERYKPKGLIDLMSHCYTGARLLKSAVALYGTFTVSCVHEERLTRSRVGFTFVVGDAVVEALRSVGRGGSVEGLHGEGARWRGLRPVLERLFCGSK